VAATAAKLAPVPGSSWWDDEVGRLRAVAPALNERARDAVVTVLVSLLHDPATTDSARRDIRNLLRAAGGSRFEAHGATLVPWAAV
jgi:hypothetical protein